LIATNYKKVLIYSIVTILFISSCATRVTDNGGDGGGDTLFPALGVDSLVEVVTWNVLFPGDFNTDYWTIDKEDKMADLIRSMDVDLLAIQEFPSQGQMDQLLAKLPGFGGILSPDINYNQKTGLIYRKETVTAEISNPRNIPGTYTRAPLPIDIRVSNQYGTFSARLIVIHFKAGGSTSDHERRTVENRDMEVYINDYVSLNPDKYIILLGDFNDTLDDSVVHAPWYQDPDKYNFSTDKIWDNPLMASLPSWGSMIDHLLLNQSLYQAEGPYLDGETITIIFNNLVSGYGDVSDHRPVMSKFKYK